MRKLERIPVFLDKIDFVHLLFDQYSIVDKKDAILIKNTIELDMELIKKFWYENPDLRFTQVLIGLGIVPNYPGFWFYKDDIDVYCEQGFPANEILFWGTYGKDGNQPISYIAIKDMTIGHLQACLEIQQGMEPVYKTAMIEELENRK